MDNYFYKNLKYLRSIKGETQDSIASYVNKGRTAIANWENNLSQPNIDELIVIAKKLDVTLDELIQVDLSEGKAMAIPSEPQKGKGKGKPLGKVNTRNEIAHGLKKGADSLTGTIILLQSLLQEQEARQAAINTHLTGILTKLATDNQQ